VTTEKQGLQKIRAAIVRGLRGAYVTNRD
jgi:hypothetical protein